jgi:site-specific recombinase XerD
MAVFKRKLSNPGGHADISSTHSDSHLARERLKSLHAMYHPCG